MQELLQAFNTKRKTNKNKWIQFHSAFHDQPVTIKSYNTWIQVATFNGKRDSGPMKCTVKTMNEWLTKFLSPSRQACGRE